MSWNGRTRCALVGLFFALLFSIFSGRLIYLQMVQHDYYTRIAADKNVGQDVIPAERGAIYDAQDEVLAQNVPVATVVADATLITEPGALISLLARRLQIPPAEIAQKIGTGRPYIVLKREVPEVDARSLEEALRTAKLRGVRCERETAE